MNKLKINTSMELSIKQKKQKSDYINDKINNTTIIPPIIPAIIPPIIPATPNNTPETSGIPPIITRIKN